MLPSVRLALLPWLSHFEGKLTFMYLDDKCRVATGIGTDLPSPGVAQKLHWMCGNATATPDEVSAEWRRVAALSSYAKCGGADPVFSKSARLFVTDESLETYTAELLSRMEDYLRRSIRNYDTLAPAAQLARIRTAYADGAAYPWPKLDAALSERRYRDAAKESQPRDLAVQNPKYAASYRAVFQLYLAAADNPLELPSPLPLGE
jgi:hypothetical protein